MSDLGEIESYLGIRITHNRSHKCIEIDQSGYVKDILDHFGMMDTNPHNTPLPAGADVHLVKNTEQASPAAIKHYQSLIGSLLYVQLGTRLDMCLCYDGANGNGLHGYSDSSMGDNTEDRHSTLGYVFLLANGTISWSSHKQKTIAQSTSEAEYMALANVANQAVWYHGFLKEIQYTIEDPVPLHGDNKGAVDLALNPVTGHQSKHIDIKHHVICEYIEDGRLCHRAACEGARELLGACE